MNNYVRIIYERDVTNMFIKAIIRRELKKIKKNSLKLRVKYDQEDLVYKKINDVINSLKIINSFEDEKYKSFALKIIGKKSYLSYLYFSDFIFVNEEYFNEFAKLLDYKNRDNLYLLDAILSMSYYYDFYILNLPLVRETLKFYMYEYKNEMKFSKLSSICYSLKHSYENRADLRKAWFMNYEDIPLEKMKEYFEYDKYMGKEKAKIEEEKRKVIKKEKSEKFRQENIDLNKPIEINTKYKMNVTINFLPVFEDFGGRYGARMVVDKRLHLDCNNFHGLVTKIASENNIYALYHYLRLVVGGSYQHVEALNDVIKHMMKIKYNLLGELTTSTTKSCYVYMCEFLMYQFGIGYEKDTNKARLYLLENAAHIKKLLIRESATLDATIVKAIFQYHEDEMFYPAYGDLLDYNFFEGYTFYKNYDYETYSWILKRLEKKGNKAFIGVILNALDDHDQNAFREKYGEHQDMINEGIRIQREEKERKEKELLEQKAKEKEERRLSFERRYERLHSNKKTNEDPLNKLSIEELKEMTNNPKAMVKVAKYYFDLGGDEHKVNYLTAMRYYNYAVEAGDKFQLINIGICYLNMDCKDTPYKDKALEIFKENYKISPLFGFYYMLEASYNEINTINEIYNYHKKNKDELVKNINEIAYLMAIGKCLESFKIYNEIKEDWNNYVSIEEYMGHFIDRYSNIYAKRDQELEIDNEVIKDEIIYTYKLGCHRIGLKLAELLYKGNDRYAYKKTQIFDKDLKEAYRILSESKDNFNSAKDYYNKLMEDISKELNGSK